MTETNKEKRERERGRKKKWFSKEERQQIKQTNRKTKISMYHLIIVVNIFKTEVSTERTIESKNKQTKNHKPEE